MGERAAETPGKGKGPPKPGDNMLRVAAFEAATVPATDSGGGGGGDGPGGYDVETMNREFAVVAIGSNVVILREVPTASDPTHRVRLMSVDAFKTWVQTRRAFKTDRDGNRRSIAASTLWLSDANRRSYDGVVFEPGDDADAGAAYNLWQGFTVERNAAGDPEPWLAHVRDNVCDGSEELFCWVTAWFAHLLQKPRDRIGTALALRGGQGAGKTIVGEIVGKLIDAHYLLVDQDRYLTGQFNAHLAQTLLLQADEAFWSGDKAQAGHLKGMITSKVQMIEHKRVDPIRVKNYVRLLVTSNEDWVVPAGRDERRWAVIDVADHRKQDASYFGKMARHFEDPTHLGGLLDYFLSLPVSDADVRAVPKTSGLYEQKIRSLDPHESWWLERLQEGAQLPGEGEWRESVERHRIYAAYIAECERVGVRRRLTTQEFGIALHKLVPALRTAQPRTWVEDDRGLGEFKRLRCYLFPPLTTARQWFEASIGQRVAWEDPPDG